MDNELSKIGDTISNFLIDDDYKIDDTLEWSEMFKVYIMRYRRIIGILILVILLGIMHHCSWTEDSASYNDSDSEKEVGLQKQKGGSLKNTIHGGISSFEKTVKDAQKAGKSPFSKGMSKLGATIKNSKLGKGVSGAAASISSAGKAIGDKASSKGSELAKETYTGSQVSKLKGAAGNALGKSKLGKFASGKMSEISALKGMGMSKAGIAKELAGQAGQYAVDKFKDFSGWLYEILFALAISIAICMIIVPSIAFFALGLICYFLLRKKISSIKAF